MYLRSSVPNIALYSLLASCCLNWTYAEDLPVDGNLLLSGSLDQEGNTLSMGTRSDAAEEPAVKLNYADGAPATLSFGTTRGRSNWQWQGGSIPLLQLKLSDANKLSLYNPQTAAVGVLLDPAGTSTFSGSVAVNGAFSSGAITTSSVTLPDGVLASSKPNTLYNATGQAVASVGSDGKVNFANGLSIGSGSTPATLTPNSASYLNQTLTNLGFRETATVATPIKSIPHTGTLAFTTIIQSGSFVYVAGSYSPNYNSWSIGGIYLYSSFATPSVFLAKLDLNGTAQWVQAINSASVSSGAIAVDGSGNVILAGAYSGTLSLATNSTLSTLAASLTPNAGGNDAFIVKYNASGVGQWVQRVGGSGSDDFKSVAVDSSGNIVAAGSFTGTTTGLSSPGTNLTSNGSSNSDAFVVKYNASGVSQWAQRVGGSSSDDFKSVAVDSSGNIVVAGAFMGTTTGLTSPATNLIANGGSSDAFVVKYNTSGVSQWSQRVGGNSSDDFKSVAVDSSGNIVAAGSFTGTTTGLSSPATNQTSNGSTDAFVVKYNTSGVSQWAKRVGGSGSDDFKSVAVDSGGNIVAAGSFYGTTTGLSSPATNLTSTGSGACIVRYDSAGTSQWAGSFGGLSSSSITHVSVSGNDAWATGFVDYSQSAPFGDTRLVGKFAIGWSGFPVSTPTTGVSSALAWGGSGAANTGVALGSSAFASAQGSTAFGVSSATAQNAFAAGSSIAKASGATAFGEHTVASGSYSTAMGIVTYASGYAATTMGSSTTASGTGSTAMGMGSTASGTYSTAMGVRGTASGNYSTAMGGGSTANGDYSTAMGSTTANAYASVAAGFGNVSQGSTTTWVATDDLFVLGNSGSSSTKSNALAVHKNGNTRIAGNLDVKGTIRVKPSGDLSMGSFTAGTNPAALSTDPLPGLNAGLRYPNE